MGTQQSGPEQDWPGQDSVFPRGCGTWMTSHSHLCPCPVLMRDCAGDSLMSQGAGGSRCGQWETLATTGDVPASSISSPSALPGV